MATVPVLTATAGCVMDSDTGEVIWSKNLTQHLPQASTTKIMTMLLLVEYNPALDQVVTVSANAAGTGGSSASISAGEVYTARELALGLMLPSGNDAAVALAEHFGQVYLGAGSAAAGVTAWVARMNARAAELGMTDTLYNTPHGMQDAGNHSCVRDLCTLARTAFSHPTVREIAGTPAKAGTPLSGLVGNPKRWQNTNHLGGVFQTVCGKTGTTTGAGACLVTRYEIGGRRFNSAILGAATGTERVAESIAMLEYARELADAGGTLTGISTTSHAYANSGWSLSNYFPSTYLDGYASYSQSAGNLFTYRFWGTGVRVLAAKNTGRGIVGIKVDGGAEVLADQYGPLEMGAVIYEVSGLTDGPHDLVIRDTGTKNAASSGTLVSLDEFHTTRVAAGTGTEPDPDEPEIVYDLQYRPGSSGSFVAVPGGTGLTVPQRFLDTSGLAGGAYQARGRARDLAGVHEDSDWSSLLAWTVEHEVVEPVPEGTFLVLDDVVYVVNATAGADLLEPEIARGGWSRAWDGSLITTADGELPGWRMPLYDLSPSAHAALLTAIARGRRLLAGGDAITAAGVAATTRVTATLDESAYVWDGLTHKRAPVLTLRTVRPVWPVMPAALPTPEHVVGEFLVCETAIGDLVLPIVADGATESTPGWMGSLSRSAGGTSVGAVLHEHAVRRFTTYRLSRATWAVLVAATPPGRPVAWRGSALEAGEYLVTRSARFEHEGTGFELTATLTLTAVEPR